MKFCISLRKMERDQKIDAFKAMGDATRFKILKLLSENGRLCVTALANRLQVAQPTVSQHLKVLKVARLVQAERIGNHIHYQIEPTTLADLAQQIAIFSSPPLVMDQTSEECLSKDCYPEK